MISLIPDDPFLSHAKENHALSKTQKSYPIMSSDLTLKCKSPHLNNVQGDPLGTVTWAHLLGAETYKLER